MKTVQLSGSLRANVGKKDAKAVRKEGRVPCVLYGSGKQTYFSVRSVDIEKIIFSPYVYRVELDIDGERKDAIIQEQQIHPVTDKAVHVDFFELVEGKEIKIGVPIRFVGQSKGATNGGRFLPIFRALNVKGLPKDLPEIIEIDVTALGIGESIHVGEVNIQGAKNLEDPKAVVVSVKRAREAIVVEVESDEEEGEETEETEGGEEGKEAEGEESKKEE